MVKEGSKQSGHIRVNIQVSLENPPVNYVLWEDTPLTDTIGNHLDRGEQALLRSSVACPTWI